MIELNHNDFPKFLQDIDLSDPSAIFCYNIIKLCCQFRNLNGLENHFVKHLYVNQWPKVESIAIVTPAHESGFDLTLTIWAKRPGDLPKFIEILDEKLQLRKKSFRHWGPRDILKHLHDHFKQVNVGVVEISESPFDCVMMPKSSFTALREENIEPPPGLTFDEIRADEAELVDSFWKFRCLNIDDNPVFIEINLLTPEQSCS